MKILLLSLSITITGLFGGYLAAGESVCKGSPKGACLATKSLCKPITTKEVCRRHFSKAKCVLGEIKYVPFVEVTYRTTDRCGKTVTWKKVYKG